MGRDQRHLKPPTAFAGNGATTRVVPTSSSGRRCYRFSRWSDIAFHNGTIPSGWQKRTTSDCRSVDELTGGRFAVTIIRGLSGGGSRCGRHQLVVARRRWLRSGTAAREGTVSLLCTPETTSFRTRRTCARRDRARDFDGWRCVNTVQ